MKEIRNKQGFRTKKGIDKSGDEETEKLMKCHIIQHK